MGEHGTAAVGQLQHGLPRASAQYAATTEDDRPLGRLQSFDGLGHDCRVGMYASDLGIIHRRGLVGLIRRVLNFLQVVGNAQHDGPVLVFRNVECLAYVVHHPRHTMRGDVMRPGGCYQRRLVDVLVVELGIDRRLSDKYHHWQAGAHRSGQRRHQLSEARAAGDGSRSDLARRYIVSRRGRYGAVLMPDVDRLHARQAGEGCRPSRRPSGRIACRPPPRGRHLRGLHRAWTCARTTKMKEVSTQYACLR